MNETKMIPLTQGKFAIVDAADYDWLMQWKWCAWRLKSRRTYYALRVQRVNGKNTTIRMHRLILNAEHGVQVDHKDGNGLNNARDNLRLATHLQNMHNSRLPINNTSGYKGVYWHKHSSKWMARINVNNKRKHLGLFTSLEEAARAYDVAALELHGTFAQTNFTHTHQETQTMTTRTITITNPTLTRKWGWGYSTRPTGETPYSIALPDHPDYTGTLQQVLNAANNDRDYKLVKSGGTYFTEAWFYDNKRILNRDEFNDWLVHRWTPSVTIEIEN